MKFILVFVGLWGLPSAYSATAIEIFQSDELEAGTVEVRAIDSPFSLEASPVRIADSTRDLLNGAALVWQVIEAGRPSANVETQSAQALPKGVAWTQLSGWQGPAVQRFEIVFKNWLGVEAVKMRFRLQFVHSGEYRKKGHYLTAVALIPEGVTALWGYQVNASVSVPGLYNLGSDRDPVAGLWLALNWKIETTLASKAFSRGFLVRGDGRVSEVSDTP